MAPGPRASQVFRHLFNDFWTLSELSECMNLWCIGLRICITAASPQTYWYTLNKNKQKTLTNQLNYINIPDFSIYTAFWLSYHQGLFSNLKQFLIDPGMKSGLLFHFLHFPIFHKQHFTFICMEILEPKAAITATRSGVCSCTKLMKRYVGWASVRERYVVGTATRSVFYSCHVQPES